MCRYCGGPWCYMIGAAILAKLWHWIWMKLKFKRDVHRHQ